MTEFSQKIEEMLEDYISPMSRELAIAVIAQFGGEEDFLESYESVCNGGINTGISGWIYTNELADFFTENKKDIIAFAKETATDLGHTSVSDMVQHFNGLKSDEYTPDQIAEAIYDTENENHQQLAAVMASFVGEEVARSYERLIEDEPDEDEDDDEDYFDDGYE
ncbi:MAG: hypothetical protein J6N72_02650 [Psychrobacter sp.]|nr:hypothetical protein [Psychrobacter sp.]